MQTLLMQAKSILTAQRSGFLASDPYPFSHTLAAYTGCSFGQTTCGLYCYAQFLPNWAARHAPRTWGQVVQVKENAAQLLATTLEKLLPEERQRLRIFMSSTTDPYQPLERRYRITRRCLEVFADHLDLDLLVVQTRSPMATDDLPLLMRIPYAWLSVTIETDDQSYISHLRGGPLLEKRWALVKAASDLGVAVQVTVSPCLPYSGPQRFSERLLRSGARRIVIDTMIDGDGSRGQRTARGSFPNVETAWADTSRAHKLYQTLLARTGKSGVSVGWSSAGFCGISPRCRVKSGAIE